MPAGIEAEVAGGFARVTFTDPAQRGRTLAALLRAGGPGLIDVDTSGRRTAYVVPESIAQQAGVLDAPKRRRKRKAVEQPPAPQTDTVTGDGLPDVSERVAPAQGEE